MATIQRYERSALYQLTKRITVLVMTGAANIGSRLPRETLERFTTRAMTASIDAAYASGVPALRRSFESSRLNLMRTRGLLAALLGRHLVRDDLVELVGKLIDSAETLIARGLAELAPVPQAKRRAKQGDSASVPVPTVSPVPATGEPDATAAPGTSTAPDSSGMSRPPARAVGESTSAGGGRSLPPRPIHPQKRPGRRDETNGTS